MKVLQIITSLETGGAENLVAEISPLISKRGIDVNVLSFVSGATPFYKKLIDNGIKVYSLTDKSKFYNLRFILKLIPYLKQYDVVHTHNTACQLFVAIAKKISNAKCKLVTTEHSTENRRRKLWWFKPIDKWMYKQYDSIISISDIATDFLIKHIGNKFPIRTIPNGVNIAKFHNAKRISEKRADDIIISMVAGFRIGKDQDTLIKSLKYLPDNYKVWLIGDGVRRKEIETLIEDLNLEDRVKLWGIRSDIPELLKTSDVIVMSSRYEGLSLSSIEGMAVDKPFIASDVKGLHETTIGAGILFPYQDDKRLAKEIKKLIEDKEYYHQVAKKCYERAMLFDISKTVEGYCDIYKHIMS